MENKRTFIAFDISAEARGAAAEYISTLQKQFPDCRASWTRPEKLHFTLRFLGHVAETRIGPMIDVVDDAARRCEKFELCLKGTGVFPSTSRARVLWLGTEGDVDAVSALRHSLDDRLYKLGFEKDEKRFTPHLTLARIKDPALCRTLINKHVGSKFETSVFAVNEILLYESKLHPSGSVYTAIHRAPLIGGNRSSSEGVPQESGLVSPK